MNIYMKQIIDFRFCIVSSDINLVLMNVKLDFDIYTMHFVVVYVSMHGLLYLVAWLPLIECQVTLYLQFRHSASQSATKEADIQYVY